MMSALISAEELKKLVGVPGVKILDASYGMPPFEQSIPGTRDFDIDDVADPDAAYTHTIPSPELFAEKVGALGIGNDDQVIVYDRSGMASAASRAWWMFRLYGHDNVKILNGGLPAWMRAGGALEEKLYDAPKPADFTPTYRPHLVKLTDEIHSNIARKDFALLDARDEQRFRGAHDPRRPNLVSGHIPNSVNTPFQHLMNPDSTLKDKAQLEKIFKDAHVDMQGKLATTCGSGVTACVVALALHELGHPDAAVYDGSWTEWGSDPELPKSTGDTP